MSEIDKQHHNEGYTGNKKNNFNGYATKVEADAAAFINTRFPEEHTTVKLPTKSNTVETSKYQYSGATFYSKEEIDNLRKKTDRSK